MSGVAGSRRGAATAAIAGTVLLALAGCADKPPAPDWQSDAKSGIERAIDAYFAGNSVAEAQEFDAVRRAIASTGRPALLARAELIRCASHVASLVVEPCTGFDRFAADAEPAERAYAAFLAGRATPQDTALLPPAQRPIAAPAVTPQTDLDALEQMAQPLSKLVGASVLLQHGRATDAVVRLAVETASAQGWRRPLRAWLQLQLARAEAGGDSAAIARVRRRIELVERGAAM